MECFPDVVPKVRPHLGKHGFVGFPGTPVCLSYFHAGFVQAVYCQGFLSTYKSADGGSGHIRDFSGFLQRFPAQVSRIPHGLCLPRLAVFQHFQGGNRFFYGSGINGKSAF